MSVWERYSKEQRNEYIQFLQVYGALSNLFRQKKGQLIPYLDSKFQETVYSRVFKSPIVDKGNTPHDVLSVFGEERIGIGLKTWMNSKPSYQKVMQLKSFREEIIKSKSVSLEALAHTISAIKNEKLRMDYERLGLSKGKNIYHYITRDEGRFVINECLYPLIDIQSLQDFKLTPTSFTWTDKLKKYKFTFGDSQIWQRFDSSAKDALIIDQFDIEIIEDPFDFLLKSYKNLFESTQKEISSNIVEAYLPLYSYRSKEVENKSGLNAWNAAPKSKGSSTLRPLNEVYIPIPRAFHKKHPNFFVQDIFQFEKMRQSYDGDNKNKPEIRFYLELPTGKRIPSLVTQSNMKGLQSGSNTEYDENGKRFGQSALGQWLLVDVLGLKERKLVTREWLEKKGTDSVHLWRSKHDYSTIYIDFAPFGAFEAFMKDEPIPDDE